MKKPVRIQVKGTQAYPDGRVEHQTFQTIGTFYERQGQYYLIYQESEATGMDGVTTILQVDRHKITVNRTGTAKQRQMFERGVLHHSTYVTPYVSLYLGALTEEMEIRLTEQGGHITLKYNLFANDERMSRNTLMIKIKEDSPQ